MKNIFLELANNQQILQDAYDYHISSDDRKSLVSRSESLLFEELIYYLKSEGENPLVKYKLQNINLFIPFFHPLSIYMRDNPLYCLDLPRIAKIVATKYNNLSVIDIGANVGDTLTLLRTAIDSPILCIEGDDAYFEVLQKNAQSFENVYLKKVLLGESNEVLQGSLTTERGTGYIETQTELAQTIQIFTLTHILQDFPDFQNSQLVKIDTDGFDYKILKGAAEFLERTKPILFFEYSPYLWSQQNDDASSVFSYLGSKGYYDLLLYDQLGYLLLSATTENSELLGDIYRYLMSKKTTTYCNIFAFHREDQDLFNTIKKAEILFYHNLKS